MKIFFISKFKCNILVWRRTRLRRLTIWRSSWGCIIGDWSEGYVLAWVGSGESENEDSDETNEEEERNSDKD